MMPSVRLDDDVFEALKSMAEPFVDTPNSVMRRILERLGRLPRREEPAEHIAPPMEERIEDSDSGGPEMATERSANLSYSTAAPVARNPRAKLTPQPVYETFLLHVLATSFPGRGGKNEVTRTTIEAMKNRGYIGPADLERVSTGETRAENTIAWGRNALKERALISRLSPKGIWELTPEGLEKGKRIILPRQTKG